MGSKGIFEMTLEGLSRKRVLLITPSLRLRDGITANSHNLILGWLESGFEVLVMNPVKAGIQIEGLFASVSAFDSYLGGERADLSVTASEFAADTAVIQYAISAYWLRTYWIHRWLKSTSVKSLVLCCHEPVRELQVLKLPGKLIYRSAFKRSSKVVLFSEHAGWLVRTLTSNKVEIYPLPVPLRRVSKGSRSNYPHFLMLGYYLKDKGFEMGLQSFTTTLKDANVPIVLSVVVSLRERVGSARLFSRRDRRSFEDFHVQLMKAKNDYPENIQIFGYLTDTEMESVVLTSDYLLMPYLDISNSGVAVTAKAHGIPVISSDLKPLVEAFGKAAIFFKAGSSIDLQDKMAEIINGSNWKFDREQRSMEMIALAGASATPQVAVNIANTKNS